MLKKSTMSKLKFTMANTTINYNNLSILTLNCQGLRDRIKRNALFSWLNCVKADIICLQETHSTSIDEFVSWVRTESDNGNNLQRYTVVSCPGSARSSGVAILYKPSLKLATSSTDDVGRLVIAQFLASTSDSAPFQVVNVYGPNSRQPGEQFFSSILPQIDPAIHSILCGDFNTVVNSQLDRMGCNPSSYWAYHWPQSLSLLTSTLSLVDAWHEKHPSARDYTWRHPNVSQASRLDMFWISSDLLSSVQQVDILPFFRLDHSYVFVPITLPSMPDRGPGVWKFNTSLLEDDVFDARIRDLWHLWQDQRDSFPFLDRWWDAGKDRLKKIMKRYSREKALSRCARISSLENTLYHLNRLANTGDDVSQFIKETKTLLELEHIHCAEGVKLRAKEQWAEEGETSSTYFFCLEKSRGMRKLFTGIRNAQGVIVHSVAAIIRVWCLFYVQLFTACVLSPPDQDFYINSLDLALSNNESALCDGDVTSAECLVALNSFKNNKSPGIDGLPYEFYKRFWPVIGEDLVGVFNDCLAHGSLSFTQRTGLISLLHKKNDKMDTKNWRPISLLCTDYKILAKVLTIRLESLLFPRLSLLFKLVASRVVFQVKLFVCYKTLSIFPIVMTLVVP